MFPSWGLLFVASAAASVADPRTPSYPPAVHFGDNGEIHVCSDTIIRVVHRPADKLVYKASLIAKSAWAPTNYTSRIVDDMKLVETSKLILKLNVSTGTVTFVDKATHKIILTERSSSFKRSADLGKPTYQVEQVWEQSSPTEGLFGGGSYQNGIVNYKNAPIEMIQYNTEAVVPFFVSTEGYGLLWDNYAWTYLNPPSHALVPPAKNIAGHADFTPAADGDHFFFVGKPFPHEGATPTYGAGGGNQVLVQITDPDGKQIVVQSWDSLANIPNSLTGRAVDLRAGVRYSVKYFTNVSEDVGLYVQGPDYGKTVLRSFIGELIDYYFVYGETMDASIAGYREITGAAPIYARWVYGFWQCKEHYASQSEVLSAARGFRERRIPVDAFVQDWHYWGNLGWGPHWDPKVYPDPAAMVRELRSLNMHLMVSVWSRFDKSTKYWKLMNDSGWLLGSSEYYDAFHPEARRLYYDFSNASMFSIGVDSLWQDATEPEDFPNANVPTYLGSGNAYMNAYSLETTRAISENLKRDYPDAQGARVFTLTRSSFASQQAVGAALWTGDITATWDSLRRQIASSINYQMSGIPYWAQDIGGFFRPVDQYTSVEYHELLTRWFQFGVFTPIFRVHGAGTNTELWNFGDEVMRNINASAINLRYRLLPYIYSGFVRVEREGYTMQRGLAMDFPRDRRTYTIADEFLFGNSFLVTPMHESGKTRSVYFPMGSWVNFHTGYAHSSGEETVTFQLEEAPVFVRAGSIVPFGPLMQHTGQDLQGSLELRVYAGSDASFTLYEDDGLSRMYQHGGASTIVFTWNNEAHELTISDRHGNYSGMHTNRSFDVVFVSPGHGVGVMTAKADLTVQYCGKHVVVRSPLELVI